MVTLTFASWNRIAGWLRHLDGLRKPPQLWMPAENVSSRYQFVCDASGKVWELLVEERGKSIEVGERVERLLRRPKKAALDWSSVGGQHFWRPTLRDDAGSIAEVHAPEDGGPTRITVQAFEVRVALDKQ